uniref:SCP domain-containing protein n=1 Tax=Electrophorus electricus TaxID=8005 RepID=A0A4W4E398_ELEEL
QSWSKEVAASSQDWANTCAMAHGPPSSRMIRGYQMGENLFQSTTPLTWTDVVTAWHSEYKNYKYGFGSINGKSIGHYTQVVWYSSYKVGCGIAKCGDRYFYSCRYYRAYVTGISMVWLRTQRECPALPAHKLVKTNSAVSVITQLTVYLSVELIKYHCEENITASHCITS